MHEESKVKQPRSKPGPINPSPKNVNPNALGKQFNGAEHEVSSKKKIPRRDFINAVDIDATEEKVPAM